MIHQHEIGNAFCFYAIFLNAYCPLYINYSGSIAKSEVEIHL